MEYKEGRLGYNRKNDRYGLLVTDLWEIDGFSCGNRLQVEINVRSVKVMSDESIAAGYMDYLHKQKKDNKF